MKKIIIAAVIALVSITGCQEKNSSQEKKDQQTVERQQAQYAAAQPVPTYDYSIERDLLIKLNNLRNTKVLTHSVWRSKTGMVLGDCPSLGFGIPYDTSLTNPLQTVQARSQGIALVAIEQAEPNGIFASKNTSATWVLCVEDTGEIAPAYVESEVNVYLWEVDVDYDKNRVTRKTNAKATVTLK